MNEKETVTSPLDGGLTAFPLARLDGDEVAREDRESEARATLTRAGFRPDAGRRFPLAMLEALADMVDEWGQDADYPDEPGKMAGHGLLAPEGTR